MDKIKNKIVNINLDKIKDNITNIDLNKIKEFVKSWELKQYLLDNINKVLSSIFVVLFTMLLICSIVFWIGSIKSYNKIQSNTKNIVFIKNNSKLFYLVKKYKLRNFTSLYDSILIKLKKKPDNTIKNELWEILAYSMCKNKSYSVQISTRLFWKNKCDFDKILNLNKQSILFKKKFYNFINKNIVFHKYINTFPIINLKNFKGYKNINTISKSIKSLSLYEVLFILNDLSNTLNKYDKYYNSYQAPYKYFLSYIYFPSQWIWKNSFSWKINVNIFWAKYLKKAWYIDLNLMRKWNNYFEKSYKWLLYQWKPNYINNIKIWWFSNIKNENLSSLPINVSFGVIDNKSFYWLISKLTSTSNILNIMLINEFTYNIWKWIKSNLLSDMNNYKTELDNNKTVWDKYLSIITDKCLLSDNFAKLNCGKLFWTNNIQISSLEKKLLHYLIMKYPLNTSLIVKNKNWSNIIKKELDLLTKNNQLKYNILSDFNWDTLLDAIYNFLSNKIPNFDKSYYAKYINNWYTSINNIDKLIWARLYWCIFNNWYCTDLFKKDNSLIKTAIIKFADCKENSNNSLSSDCRIKFINKFWTNYFIWYTMVNPDVNYTLLDRLKDVYTNLSWLIKLNSFSFRKWGTVWNINNIAYTSTVSLNIFYRSISNKYVNDILNYIWKYKCSAITNWSYWSIDKWYNYIKHKISNLYNSNLWANGFNNLNVLSNLLLKLKSEGKEADNLNKILLNLQAYRILKNRWDCGK